MSSNKSNMDVVCDIRRKIRAIPVLLLVSLSGIMCACTACATIRYVAGGKLPVIRLNIVFFLVLLSAVVAGVMFFLSTRSLLRRVLRLVDEIIGEKDAMIGYVLHDLKSPISSISSNAQLMMAGKRGIGKAGEAILSSCDKVVKIIDSSIAITNNYVGMGGHGSDHIEMKSLIEDIVEESLTEAKNKGIRLTCEVPADELRFVADLQKIDSLVCNLLENALKYTPAGGSVHVAVRATGGGFALKVADTGIGMTPEVQSHMYERFYRADPSCAESGSGLGLALVKSIVEFYGGDIQCSSSPGQGTTFTVTLEAKAAK